MTVANIMEEARNSMHDFLRKYKFKKANAQHAKTVELRAEMAKCRGRLEVCKKDFDRAIRKQSLNIAEGKKIGADTLIQEAMLEEAAVGYLLVRDALYSMTSIESFDSITHAYELLGVAMDKMNERTSVLPKLPKPGRNKERNRYAFKTSSTLLDEKEKIVGEILENLKQNGDIEKCIAERGSEYDLDSNPTPTPASAPAAIDDDYDDSI